MATAPNLLITEAGLIAASIATPTGPYIEIVSFSIASGYGYTPTTGQTGFQGTVLYSGVPASYNIVSGNTIDIQCQIPPNAGPWSFGEVGLFLPGGVLFAIAVFPTQQTKYSSLGTNVASSYVLNCLLTLQQSVSVFQITTSSTVYITEANQWSDIVPPSAGANPALPQYIVKELTPAGDSSLLENANPNYWTVGAGYFPVNNSVQIQSATNTWIQFSSSTFYASDLTAVNRQWLIQTPQGYFRSVNNFQVAGSNYQLNLNCTNDGTYNNSPLPIVPTAGTYCRIYSYIQTGDIIHWSQIVDAPPLQPTGSIVYTAAQSPPLGYIAANGAAVSRTTYNVLFAALGTVFGAGDGSTTFNVPDMRGVFPRGFDNGRGLDPGRTFGSYQADAFASHNHGVNDPGHTHTINDPGHNHHVNDPSHAHGISDPSHAHSIYDPGHAHQYDTKVGVLPQSGNSTNCWYGDSTAYTSGVTTGIGIYASYTGITINASYTGVTLNAAATGVSNNGSYTGITTAVAGGTETRGKNVALLAVIKY